MTKQEFMKELESLLSDIPLEEREEALKFYDNYFEDAGREHEEIIKELGSPAEVAGIIKAELLTNSEESKNRGYFTENGYSPAADDIDKYDIIDAGRQAGNGYGKNESANGGSSNNQSQTVSKNSNKGLLILIAVCTSFIWGPFVLGAAGVVLGIATTILGLLFGFGVVGICLMVVGISLCISGIIQLSVPAIGALMIGGGLILLGIGMLITLAFIIVCKKLLPATVRGIADLCSRPFKNRRVFV